jgi:TonB-dependent receptor
LSNSYADLDQPDKRLFGSIWLPPFIHPLLGLQPGRHIPLKSDANFSFGNLQRIWKEIEEESRQVATDIELPFEQWDGVEGYVKAGLFVDRVERTFDQDTFSNFADNDAAYVAPFEDLWSAIFPSQGGHPISAANSDVDYDGEQDIDAFYGMFDLPLSSRVSVVAGARWESTKIGITNDAEADATWIEPGQSSPSDLDGDEADVDFEQQDLLPAVALRYDATEAVTLRASYAETVARQTFKELTPILQQEYYGGPAFIGNPSLEMANLRNWDLRLDFRPDEDSLLSASWFHKDIEDPIETVQRVGDFSYTTAVNYPEGELTGWELEVRQHLGRFSGRLDGLSLGANATFIDSEVTLPDDEAALFDSPSVQAPMKTRDATNAPEHLYNLYLTYDLPRTRFGVFYTVRGDTLSAGATVTDNNFVPSVYDKQYGTLNATVSRRIGTNAWLTLQGKNLTNPEIEQVYRADTIDGDATRTSYTAGREFTIGISVSF